MLLMPDHDLKNGNGNGNIHHDSNNHLSLASSFVTNSKAKVELNGYNLTLPQLVRVARHSTSVGIKKQEIEGRIQESVDYLKSKVSHSTPSSCPY